MKQILLLVFLVLSLSFSAFGQMKFREIDLRVNGIGSGTSYSTVIRNFGKPQRTETKKYKASQACSNSAETHLTLFYSGLDITLLGDGRGRKKDVYAIEITSKKWSASGISIGADMKSVETRFGKPYSKEEKWNETVFHYVTKDNLGGVNFYFRNNKLIKLLMKDTLC